MTIVRPIGVIIFIFLLQQSVFGIVAKPGLIMKYQPDGTPVEVYLRGDKWQHWFEIPNGYSVVKNAYGEWVYAVAVENGELVPGDIKVDGQYTIERLESRGIDKHLKPQRKEMRAYSPVSSISRMRDGKFKIPVILVNFPDMEHKYRKENFVDMMNKSNYKGTGSFQDYFKEVSYGQFLTSATVVGWFTAEHEHDYYGEDEEFSHQIELARQAVDEAEKADLDWSQFDNDGDGQVDGVVIIHTGRGAEEGDDSNIWSFKGELSQGNKRVRYDGVWIDAFTIQPEKEGNGQSNIGVYVHEYGHILGLPDLYDTDNSSEGIGNWGLMAGGAWGGNGSSPWKPSHMCAWSKAELGWLSSALVDSFTQGLEIEPIESNPVAYRINNPYDVTEYFLLANRQKTGFDGMLSTGGLLIWHIDEERTSRWPGSNNVNADEPHYGVGLEQADGRFHLENGENRGDSGDPFPGRKKNTLFDNGSLPDSKNYYSQSSYIAVYNIILVDSLVITDVWIPQSGAPYITMKSYSLEVTSGDDDTLLNPGETASIRLVIANSAGADVAANVVAEISSDDPDLIFISNRVELHEINPGSTSVNTPEQLAFSIVDDALPHTIPITVTVTSGEGTSKFELVSVIEIDVTLSQEGYPFFTQGAVKTAPTIVDIDQDGKFEVIAASDDNSLYVLNKDGDLKWSFTTGSKIRSTPAVGDVDGDGDLEIVFTSIDKNLYILDSSGEVQLQYQAKGLVKSTVALKDLDSNGDLEIIFGDVSKHLYVVNHDGSDFGSFPVYVGETLLNAPAVGDLNNDATWEIVVGTWQNHLYAYNSDGSIVTGFPYTTGEKINTDPVLADLDGDGYLEILFGSDDDNLYVIDRNGSQVFVYQTGGNVLGSPTVDDLDGDGLLEIFFGSNDKKLYGINSKGKDLPGWPFEAERNIQSAAVFFDLDDDGIAEVINAATDGSIFALTLDGELFPNFPVKVPGPIQSSFSIDDVDGDGDAEIASGSSFGIELIDVKSKMGKGYYWDMYRGNLHRTGFLGDSKLSVDESKGVVPFSFEFYPNYPNPFNPTTTLRYTIPERALVTVDIYNVLGQHVTRLFERTQAPGSYHIRWDSSGQGGTSVSGGIYFVRLEADGKVRVRKVTLLK